jgi:hypothetical protein
MDKYKSFWGFQPPQTEKNGRKIAPKLRYLIGCCIKWSSLEHNVLAGVIFAQMGAIRQLFALFWVLTCAFEIRSFPVYRV